MKEGKKKPSQLETGNFITSQFCIAMKIAVIVVTVSGFFFLFSLCKCEGGEGAGQVTVSAHKHDVHRSWGNNWKSLPAWITFHMLYKGQCV